MCIYSVRKGRKHIAHCHYSTVRCRNEELVSVCRIYSYVTFSFAKWWSTIIAIVHAKKPNISWLLRFQFVSPNISIQLIIIIQFLDVQLRIYLFIMNEYIGARTELVHQITERMPRFVTIAIFLVNHDRQTH